MSATRRTFLTNAAGIGAAWIVADWALVNDALVHAASAVQQQPAPAFTILSRDEAVECAAIAERIMPTTTTPGAREAGVIFFMDKALGGFQKNALPDVRKGLADLRGRVSRFKKGTTSFARLTAAEQDTVLTAIETTDFFQGMRFLTMLGMFANPSFGGNRGQVGWNLIDFHPAASHKPPFGYYDAQATRGAAK